MPTTPKPRDDNNRDHESSELYEAIAAQSAELNKLTHALARVSERLEAAAGLQKQTLDKLVERVERMDTKYSDFYIRLSRIEDKGIDDLQVRMDRLEREAKSRMIYFRIFAGAAIASIIASIAAIIQNHLH